MNLRKYELWWGCRGWKVWNIWKFSSLRAMISLQNAPSCLCLHEFVRRQVATFWQPVPNSALFQRDFHQSFVGQDFVPETYSPELRHVLNTPLSRHTQDRHDITDHNANSQGSSTSSRHFLQGKRRAHSRFNRFSR